MSNPVLGTEQKGGAAAPAALLEKCVFAALILLAGGAFHMAGSYGDGTISGGSLFPRLATGVVVAMSLLSLLRPAPVHAIEPDRGLSKPASYVALLTLVFLIGLPVIGYPILAPLWMGATMWTFGLRSIPKLLLVALGISAIAWLLLARFAFAPPPAGWLAPFF